VTPTITIRLTTEDQQLLEAGIARHAERLRSLGVSGHAGITAYVRWLLRQDADRSADG